MKNDKIYTKKNKVPKIALKYDLDLENFVLGCILFHGAELFAQHDRMLIEKLFYADKNKIIYQSMKNLFDSGKEIDEIITGTKIKQHQDCKLYFENVYYELACLTKDIVPIEHNLVNKIILLHELRIERETERIGLEFFESADKLDALSKIDKQLQNIFNGGSSDGWNDASEVAYKLMQNIDNRANLENAGLIRSGFGLVDRLNGGFKPGQLIVFGARPSVGKSAFAIQVAKFIAEHYGMVGIINLEMDNEDVMERMLANDSGVDSHKIKMGLKNDEVARAIIIESINKLATYKIKFSDTIRVTYANIRSKAILAKNKYDLKFLIIDYLQLVDTESSFNKNREREVADLSRNLKALALELKIPIFVLAQLNRSGGENTAPKLGSLRESGAIEQDADIVMFLWADELQMPIRKISIAKWRNGSTTGENEIGWDGATQKFYDNVNYKIDVPDDAKVNINQTPNKYQFKSNPFDEAPTNNAMKGKVGSAGLDDAPF
jgi:replicative DNA helicase